MHFEWDEVKNQLNIKKHGLSFRDAKQLFTGPLIVNQDKRYEYNEKRYIGYGELDNRVMCVVYTERALNKIRIISFRKANNREKTYYWQSKKQD